MNFCSKLRTRSSDFAMFCIEPILHKQKGTGSSLQSINQSTVNHILFANMKQGSCARRLKNSTLFKAFSFNNSRPIQGLLPVDHSTAYNPTGTREKHTDLKHSCKTFINNKRSKQFFYPLNSNCGRKFSQSPSLVESFT